MKSKLFILLFALIILSGCAGHNVPKEYSFNQSSPKAVIVGSLTNSVSSLGETGFGTGLDVYMVHYRKIGTNQSETINIKPDIIFSRSHFKNLEGQVFVIELDAGEYELYSWYVRRGSLSMQPTKIFSRPFTIKPGSITYIGEINFEVLYGQNLLGFALISSLKLNIKDSYQRDIQIFRNDYKNLAKVNINKNLIQKSNYKKVVTEK